MIWRGGGGESASLSLFIIFTLYTLPFEWNLFHIPSYMYISYLISVLGIPRKAYISLYHSTLGEGEAKIISRDIWTGPNIEVKILMYFRGLWFWVYIENMFTYIIVSWKGYVNNLTSLSLCRKLVYKPVHNFGSMEYSWRCLEHLLTWSWFIHFVTKSTRLQ